MGLALVGASCGGPDAERGEAPATSPPAGAVSSPLDPKGVGTFEERTLRFGGEGRTYGVYLPDPLPEAPSPLVVFLHGPAERDSPLADELESTGLAPVADQEGFLIALPTSLSGPWRVAHDAAENEAETEWLASFGRRSFAAAGWDFGDEDADFIMAVLDEVASTEDVDPTRVYSVGKQNGAFMATRMVCDHSDRFAAVATLAGGLRLSEPCAADRPVPGFTTMGALQATLPTELAEQGAAEWADRNGCGPTPAKREVARGVSEIRYQGCEADVDVVLHVVEGVTYLWPWPPTGSAGARIGDYHPGTVMWRFLFPHAIP